MVNGLRLRRWFGFGNWKLVFGISFVICHLSFVILLGGCAPTEKPAGNEITLNMWVMPNSLNPISDIEDLLVDFKKQHPNINVKITSVDWGAGWTKITTAATSGDVPDIVQLGSTWVGAISGMGALENLSASVEALGGAKTFLPVAWTTSGIAGSKTVTAIPWIVDARALFYRTDVFKKAKIDTADLDNWNSFKSACKKIKEAHLTIDGIVINPLGISGKNDWNVIHSLAPWIWAAGGNFLTPDNKKGALDSPEVLNGILFYISLVREGLVPLEYLELNTAQVSSNFNNGAVGMYFDGPYEVKTLTRPFGEGGSGGSLASRNFSLAGYPKGPKGRFSFIGGSNLAIFKASKHKAESFEVIKFLSSKKAQLEYSKISGFLPARLDVFDDPYFASDPKRKVFKEAVLYGKTYPCVPAWGILEPILTRRFGIMWDYVTQTEKFSPKEIEKQLKLAKSEIDTILAQGKNR